MWKRPVVEERITEVAMVVGQCSYWSGKLGVDEADHLYWHEQLVVVLLAAAAAAAAAAVDVVVAVVLVFVVCWEDGDAGWPLD
jgi:hypothetical protein